MQLKFMTYNIQGHAASRRADHLPKVAETIAAAAPDIVGLQEVHCRTKASKTVDQAEQLAELTGMNLSFGRSCGMGGGDYGNAILTRGSIVSTVVHPLPGSGEARSLLQAAVHLHDREFTFFVTHLEAWGRLRRATRLQQIAELGDITGRGPFPHVLVGDFNVPPRTEEVRLLLERGHLRSCGDTKHPTYPMMRQRLDYIFCDAQWEFVGQEVVKRGPSDHWPLVAELRLRTDS